MRKARPRRPSIQYSKDDSSAPAVGQAEESPSGPGGGGGGGGWGSSDDDSARWAAANAAVRTSAAISLVLFELAWITVKTARGFVCFSVYLPYDESEDTAEALKEQNQHHLQYLFCNSDKAVVRSYKVLSLRGRTQHNLLLLATLSPAS